MFCVQYTHVKSNKDIDRAPRYVCFYMSVLNSNHSRESVCVRHTFASSMYKHTIFLLSVYFLRVSAIFRVCAIRSQVKTTQTPIVYRFSCFLSVFRLVFRTYTHRCNYTSEYIRISQISCSLIQLCTILVSLERNENFMLAQF